MIKNSKVYVYLHEDIDNTLILSERELSDDERYCPVCENYWRLILVTDDLQKVIETARSFEVYVEGVVDMFNLLQEGVTYNEINHREISMYEEEW